MKNLYALGWSCDKISEYFGECSAATIRRRLIDAGVKLTRRGRYKGDKSSTYKGGRRTSSNGYVYVLSHNHPNRDKNNEVSEHRLVMERYLGRYLERDEEVHHINETKTDNKISNLELLSKSDHTRLHHSGTNNNHCVLSEKDIHDIRSNIDGLSGVELAEKHDVTSANISAIRNKKTWKHI